MLEATAFVIVMAFTSWDACWDYVHEHGLQEDYIVCDEGVIETGSGIVYDPARIRPKARDD